jgi:hypothetical protein
MCYLVQAHLDGRWLTVGDPLDDIRDAAAVRSRLASGGLWSQSRIAVLDEWNEIVEVIDDSEPDGGAGATERSGKVA